MPSKCGVTGTLYTYPENFRAQLIQISAEYGSSSLTVAPFEYGSTDTDPAFCTKFPFGKCPAFESAEGNLFETMAIASYVGSDSIRGSTELARAQISQWMSLAEQEVLPSACQWLYPCYGLMPNNKNIINKAKETIRSFLKSMNSLLEPKTYLVGEYVSLADLTMAMYMRALYTTVMDGNFIKEFGNVTRWFTTIMNQPEVVRIVGETKLCEKMAQFDPKLFSANNPKTPKPGKAAAPKAEAPKKEAAPAAAEAEAPKPPPKKKPFDDLPKSDMNMDDFKRLYWNKPTEEILEYLDKNMKEGEWTAWKCTYKYNSQLTKLFKTNNLVQGMMQRLEGLRKFGFGLLYVFGENDNNAVYGVWLTRGPTNPFLECEDWQIDIVSYDLEKLDMNVPEQKKILTDFIAGSVEEYNGLQFVKDHIF